MFYLTRLGIELLSPINISLFFLITSLLCLILNKKKLSILTLSFGVVILIYCGYAIGVKEDIYAKERKYFPLTDLHIAKLANEKIKYVVILGSGHVSDKHLPVTSQIGGASIYRLIEGIRIQRRISGSKLLISGGVAHDPVPNAFVVRNVAEQIGVIPSDIIVLDKPRDTIQEAEELFMLIKENKFVLVTSALHMPRAMNIFANKGMHPIPAPTNYIIKKHLVKPPSNILPNAYNLVLTKRLLYEWLGALRNFIKSKDNAH